MGSHHVVPVGYELSSLSASCVAKTTGVAHCALLVLAWLVVSSSWSHSYIRTEHIGGSRGSHTPLPEMTQAKLGLYLQYKQDYDYSCSLICLHFNFVFFSFRNLHNTQSIILGDNHWWTSDRSKHISLLTKCAHSSNCTGSVGSSSYRNLMAIIKMGKVYKIMFFWIFIT